MEDPTGSVSSAGWVLKLGRVCVCRLLKVVFILFND